MCTYREHTQVNTRKKTAVKKAKWVDNAETTATITTQVSMQRERPAKQEANVKVSEKQTALIVTDSKTRKPKPKRVELEPERKSRPTQLRTVKTERITGGRPTSITAINANRCERRAAQFEYGNKSACNERVSETERKLNKRIATPG